MPRLAAQRLRLFGAISMILCLGIVSARPGIDAPRAPSWPTSFEVSYNFILPYVASVQSNGLSYPVQLWYDGPGQRLRVDVFGGLDSLIVLPAASYSVYPRILDQECDVANATVGPTAASGMAGLLRSEGGMAPPLPDLKDWTYSGVTKIRNNDASMWRLSEKHGEKVCTYIFSTSTKTGWPLQLKMMGVNLFSGSHYDEYLVEFTRFVPGPVAPSAFGVPKVCQGAAGGAGRAMAAALGAGVALAPQLLSLLPRSVAGAATAAQQPPGASSGSLLSQLQRLAHTAVAWAETFASQAAATALQHGPDNAAGRAAAAHENELQNKQYSANKRMVDEHNVRAQAGGASYTLELNRFSSMPHDMWQATKLGLARRGAAERLRAAGGRANLGAYQRVLSNAELPSNVDYRGTGADGPVLDQASCGSCWSFAAAGAMQGAWYLTTGETAMFSEQQLVDCSWEYGNNGCGGGFMEGAIQYIAEQGGVAVSEDYQYIGQNGYCRANKTTREGRGLFSGYKNVPSYDEGALMEALFLHGPVAISFEVTFPLKFYSEGVYHDDACHTDVDHLNHAVLLVGYGTDNNGTDYWLLKNSWSSLWGNNGYFKLTRKGNDCGITAGAVMAVVNGDEFVRRSAGNLLTSPSGGLEHGFGAVDSKQQRLRRAQQVQAEGLRARSRLQVVIKATAAAAGEVAH